MFFFLVALLMIIMLYAIWGSVDSFYDSFFNLFKKRKKLYTLKKSQGKKIQEKEDSIRAFYSLFTILFVINAIGFMASLITGLFSYNILVLLLIWIIYDLYKYSMQYYLGAFISDDGILNGIEFYPWEKIAHHRWLIKERPKKDFDQAHIIFRKRRRIVPLTLEVHVNDVEKVQDILDRYIQNTEKDLSD